MIFFKRIFDPSPQTPGAWEAVILAVKTSELTEAESGIGGLIAMRGQCLSWINRVVLTVDRPLPVFPDQLNRALEKSSDFQKLSLTPSPNHLYIPPIPALFRGAYHDRHETLGRDAVDAAVSGAQMVAGRLWIEPDP
jgi:hypothetical protein